MAKYGYNDPGTNLAEASTSKADSYTHIPCVMRGSGGWTALEEDNARKYVFMRNNNYGGGGEGTAALREGCGAAEPERVYHKPKFSSSPIHACININEWDYM